MLEVLEMVAHMLEVLEMTPPPPPPPPRRQPRGGGKGHAGQQRKQPLQSSVAQPKAETVAPPEAAKKCGGRRRGGRGRCRPAESPAGCGGARGDVRRHCAARVQQGAGVLPPPWVQDGGRAQYDVKITPEVSSRYVNRAIIAELVRLYRESDLGPSDQRCESVSALAGEEQGRDARQQNGPQRQFVVRRFHFAFQLDLALIIKLAAVVFLFSQEGSKQRVERQGGPVVKVATILALNYSRFTVETQNVATLPLTTRARIPTPHKDECLGLDLDTLLTYRKN